MKYLMLGFELKTSQTNDQTRFGNQSRLIVFEF